jgi:hypothetical protein
MNPDVMTVAAGVAGHVTIWTVADAESITFGASAVVLSLPPQPASTRATIANRVMAARYLIRPGRAG